MQKTIFVRLLLPLLFLLVPIIVFSTHADINLHEEYIDCDSSYIFCDIGDILFNGTAFSHTPASGEDLSANTPWEVIGTSCVYTTSNPKDGNMTIFCDGSSTMHGNIYIWTQTSGDNDLDNLTVQILYFDDLDTTGEAWIDFMSPDGTLMIHFNMINRGAGANYGYGFAGSTTDSGISIQSVVNLTFYINDGATNNTIWINDIFIDDDTVSPFALGKIGQMFAQAGKTSRWEIRIWKGTPEQRPQVVPLDTCTAPGSGDWDVDCSDNCVLDSAQDVVSDMHLNGAGTIVLSAPLTFTGSNQLFSIASGCTLDIRSGGEIGGT